MSEVAKGRRSSQRDLLRSSFVSPFLRCAFVLSVLFVLSVASLSGQAPPDRWPQFRGSPNLLGTTQATLPAQLKVQWTYEAGDAIESSAAIVDGVVYGSRQSGAHRS